MEIWFPSHDNYKTSHIGVRIMNIDKFVNSKRLFRTMRCERVSRQRSLNVHFMLVSASLWVRP